MLYAQIRTANDPIGDVSDATIRSMTPILFFRINEEKELLTLKIVKENKDFYGDDHFLSKGDGVVKWGATSRPVGDHQNFFGVISIYNENGDLVESFSVIK